MPGCVDEDEVSCDDRSSTLDLASGSESGMSGGALWSRERNAALGEIYSAVDELVEALELCWWIFSRGGQEDER